MKEQQKQDNKEVQLPDWFKRDVEKEPVEDVEESFGPFPNLVWVMIGTIIGKKKQPDITPKRKWWSFKRDEPKTEEPEKHWTLCFPTKEDCITWSLKGSSVWFWPGDTQPYQMSVKEVVQIALKRGDYGVELLDGEGNVLASWKILPG